MRISFTERRVRELKPPVTGRLTVYDDEVHKLALRITAAGIRTWSVVARQGGRVAWVSLGRWPEVSVEAARTAAEKVLPQVRAGTDVIAERRERESRRVGGVVPLLAAAGRLLDKLRTRGRAEKHIREIERIANLAHEAGVRDLADRGVAAAAASWLESLDVAPQTRNRIRRHLIAIGKEALRWWPPEAIAREPFLPLGGAGAPLPPPPTFDVGEAMRLACDDAVSREDTGGPLWAWLLLSGCRLSEGCWARWDRVDLGRRVYAVAPPTDDERALGYKVKRSRGRTVELHPEVVDLLARWMALATTPYLFHERWRTMTSAPLMRAFRRHLEALGIERGARHIHSLRHAHACISLAAGVDGLRLQLAMGHAGPEMTRHYAGSAMRLRGQVAHWNGTLRLRDPVEVARLTGASADAGCSNTLPCTVQA